MKPIQARSGARQSVLVPALGAMLLFITACGGGGGSGNDSGKAGATTGKAGSTKTAVSKAVVTIAPKNGAAAVDTSGALKVTAAEGKLTSVVVKDSKGNAVEGAIATGGGSWAPSETLGTSTKYTVDAVAKDTNGRESAKHATFTTVVPKGKFVGTFTPEDGSTVGTGMEVSLNFTHAIAEADKKAVEQAIKVTASPSVPVAGRWYGNQRIDFRPEKYWAAGTKVTLSLHLKGVKGAPGIYGTQHKDVHFTIGRSQVSIVDAAKHTMKVYRSGKLIKTLPITAGAPGKTTWNGKMVISEKHLVTRMDGATVGYGGEYDIPDVPHAMRLTTSGTFLHGNYWASASTFGSANVSHGCVGLRDVKGGGSTSTPAAWMYNNSIIGDVVQVKNSKDHTVQWYNGLNGWNLSWSQWTKAS